MLLPQNLVWDVEVVLRLRPPAKQGFIALQIGYAMATAPPVTLCSPLSVGRLELG